MPLLKLETSVEIPEEKRAGLLKSLSSLISGAIGKPEQYVMVTLGRADIALGGQQAGAAFADVRSIGGLDSRVNARITRELCDILDRELGIDSGRVYVTFTDVAASDWGWNGSTFG